MLPALAIPLFAKAWWKLAVGAVIGAALCFPLAQCDGKRIGRQQMQLAIERANTETLKQTRRADEAAAAQRLTDERLVSSLERELTDAVADIPDSLPTARRLARACAQLRAQGVDTAGLSQCQRTGS